jgi:hypothetical protein
MDTVKQIHLEITTIDEKNLLSETHNIVMGSEGLLRIPQRFGLVAQYLVCFPSEEKAVDFSNMGTPFDVICSIFEAGCGPYIATILKSADYTISAKSCAYL